MAEHKGLWETVWESGEGYRRLFENLNDAAFLPDAETGLIIDTNLQGTILLGRSYDEILGMHQTELYPSAKADEYRQRLARYTKQGHAVDHEAEVIRKDGTIVPVMISSSTLTIGGRCLIVSSVTSPSTGGPRRC